MKPIFRNAALGGASLAVIVLASGCVLSPRGTKDERARLDEAGVGFEPPVEQRALPDLPAEPTWRDVLRRALLANGEVEAAYFDWKAAMQRIDIAAGYPNANVSLGLEYMFSSENVKAWDRTTVTAGFDPMQNLSWPSKVKQAGKVALDEARAAGSRFQARKFEVQQKVLETYLDYALAAEKVRIQRENVELQKMLSDAAANRVKAGEAQQAIFAAQIQHDLAENELRNLEAQLPQTRATLNALMGRAADAPLSPPEVLPAPRPIPGDDAMLLAVGAQNNPELATLAYDVAGRRDALELARMQYIPDVNPVAGFTGSIEQFVGAMITLPTTIPQIRASIREARAMLRGTEATTRQARLERGADFVATLYAIRNHERQIEWLEDTILPAAEQFLASARQTYATRAGGFSDLIESQRTLLEVRLMTAEARTAREKRLAELETLAGLDIETLIPPTTRPATREAEVHHD